MKIRLLMAAVMGAATLSAQAADAAKGEKLAQAQCVACHGKDFVTPVDPTYPKLAGQYADYLEKALRDYQSGGRKNPIMKGFAGQLSKKDIEDLAAWFSSQKSHLHDQR